MIYFGTDGIRGIIGESNLNPDFILRLGYAVGQVLFSRKRGPVIIGKDTRISGYMIESALEAGLSAAGVEILLTGPLSTPAVSCLVSRHDASAAFVISASHNPYNYNGIKIFNSKGEKLSIDDENEIESILDTLHNDTLPCVETNKLGKARRLNDAVSHYHQFLNSCLESKTSFSSLKIVFDGAHGSAYALGPSFLRGLGADVSTLGCSPDGLNINRNCGALYPEALKNKVDKTKADIGISLDGDADRLILYSKGRMYDGDEILYVLSYFHYLQKSKLIGVVGTELSNRGLEIGLNSIGIKFSRAKVGDKNIYHELKNKNWLLGGEPSGHIILRDFLPTGDGLLAAIKVIEAMLVTNKDLAELCKEYVYFPSHTANIKIDPPTSINKIIQSDKVKEYLADVKRDENALPRIVLRASGTESVLRIHAEASTELEASKIVDQLEKLLINEL